MQNQVGFSNQKKNSSSLADVPGEETVENKKKKLLQIRRLSKAYPGVQALDGVDLDIHRGEIHALLGQNGAGKSTLIKLLSGVERPDSGTLHIDSKSISIKTPEDAHKHGIFTIHQELSLVPDLSVAENIFITDLPTGRFGVVNWTRLSEQATEAMEWLGFLVDVHSPIRKLSVAQKQGVELAKALHHKAKLVLLDEPTAALPPQDVERLFKVIRTLQARGLSFIYISHRMEEVQQLCSIATVLRDGQKVGTYSIAETKPNELIRSMIGRSLKSSHVGETALGKRKPRLGLGGTEKVVMSVRGLDDGRSVSNINFDLNQGEILGITGLIGHGQSEFAACMFGARDCVCESISVNGKTVRIRTPGDAIRAGVGLLPEERKTQGLVLHMSIESNITMASHNEFSKLSIIDRKKEQHHVNAMSTSLSIRAGSVKQPVGTLSGGNQQKVVLAKWLVSKCGILIFSEPTRGVDVGAKEEIYELIKSFVNSGGSVILISSEMPEALMCDRVFVMSNGKFVGELNYDEIDPHADAILNLCCQK
ncbi:MAG: ribose transport system ATP-binding protein [Verrucomicrobiota bacterium]|nr:ribose transport system ATP-binding protein [Verrucomicrobiota bacterium]